MKGMNNKYILLCSMFILIAISFLSIGYASFTNDLTIGNIGAEVRIEKDVRISNISIKSVSSGTVVTYDDYNVHNVDCGIILPNADSYAIFDVELTNLGNSLVGIYNIINNNPNLKYEIVNDSYLSDTTHHYNSYNLKDVLVDDNDNNLKKNGARTHILLKASYVSSDHYNSSGNQNNFSLSFDIREFYTITYSPEFNAVMTTPMINNVIRGDSLIVGINTTDISKITVNSGGSALTANADYTLNDKVLTINSIVDNTHLGFLNTVSGNGITIDSNWLAPNKVEISLNGKAETALYIRIRDGDTYIGTNASSLYKADYARNPMFFTNDEVYIDYHYVEGTYQLVSGQAFTVKYRDATSKCSALNASELIANYPTANFQMNENFRNSAVLPSNVSQISMFFGSGNSFNNYKFVVTYGKVSDDETGE